MSQTEFITMLRENHDKMFLTKKEACKELSISEGTLDRLRKDGKITSRKVLGQIMFDIGELARFMADA